MILMDLSQVCLSNIMAELKNTNNADISVPLIRHMILNTIRANRQKFKREYGELVIACDNRNYWRKAQFPYYKANRKKNRDNSAFDWDQIYAAMNEVTQDLTEYFPYPVINVEGAEADDVIGTLVQWSAENDLRLDGLEEGPQPLLILSGDHDFVQLQRFSHVQQYSPIHKKWVKADSHPSHMLTEHILRGDDGDGIPNFLSDDDTFVTPKKRQKSIFAKDMITWRTQSLDIWKDTPHWTNVQRNRMLIDLTQTPADIQAAIIHKYLTDRTQRNRSQLMNYFMKHKMPLMMECLGDF